MLAWGNSLGDYFVNYVISKNGEGMMAVTGTYSGQIFNLFCGFGGAMFRQSLKGTVVLNLFQLAGKDDDTKKTDILTMVLVSTNFFALLATLAIAKANKWTLGKGLLTFVLAVYGGFLVTASVISFI